VGHQCNGKLATLFVAFCVSNSGGRKIRNARLTALHNGVKIHTEVMGPTRPALDSNVTEAGSIYLQEHGNPVQYRNIWLVELPE
jgi:hypothetical protein